jgi:hypothetical protein
MLEEKQYSLKPMFGFDSLQNRKDEMFEQRVRVYYQQAVVSTVINSKQNEQAETSFPELQQGTTNQSIPQSNDTTVD